MPVVVAKTVNEPGLFLIRADNEEKKGNAAGYEDEPVGGGETVGENYQPRRDINWMTDPAVWAAGDERVVFSGNDGICQIRAEVVKGQE